MRVARSLIASLLFAFSAIYAAPAEPPASSPAYEAIDHAIEGLARASAALDDVNAKSQASLVARMTSVQNASIELEVVKKFIEPLASSTNQNLTTGIQAQIAAYEAMQKALGLTLFTV